MNWPCDITLFSPKFTHKKRRENIWRHHIISLLWCRKWSHCINKVQVMDAMGQKDYDIGKRWWLKMLHTVCIIKLISVKIWAVFPILIFFLFRSGLNSLILRVHLMCWLLYSSYNNMQFLAPPYCVPFLMLPVLCTPASDWMSLKRESLLCQNPRMVVFYKSSSSDVKMQR